MDSSKIVDLYHATVDRMRSDEGEITRTVVGLARGTLRKGIRATLAAAGVADFRAPKAADEDRPSQSGDPGVESLPAQ